MGLFGFFGPKWQHKNPEVRLAAVRDMDAEDLDTLLTLARADEDSQVRLAAAQRIDDRTSLEALLGGEPDPEVQREAWIRLEPLLFRALIEASPGDDPAALLARIQDPALLARVAVEGPSPGLRVDAVARIDDPESLCAIVEQNCGKEAGKAAVAKINDPPLLRRVADGAASKVTRRLAEEKLADQSDDAAGPTVDLAPGDAEYGPLIAEATALATTTTGDDPAGRLDELETAWRRLDPELAQPRWPAFVAARNRARETHAETERSRAETLQRALAAVEALVSSQAADAARRFQEAREEWGSAAGALPAGDDLARRYTDACEQFGETQRALASERSQLAAWEAELAALEDRVSTDEGAAADRDLAALATAIQEASLRHVDSAPLLDRIRTARTRWVERRKEIEADRANTDLQRRKDLCVELEALCEAEDRGAAGRRAKQLQGEWKKLPPVSDKRQGRSLDKRFQAAREQFKVSQGPYLEQQEWQRWANRTKQETLCAEVEALDAVEDLAVVAERVKDAHKRWKEIGPAPRADAEALWLRFKEACDRNFERCKPHFDELARQRAAAVERKEELCLQAEEHAESVAWKESSEALKALQAAWKEAGPVPRKKDQAMYKRFRAACDRFFERRQEHFAELDEQRRGNQGEKEKLCARAEALADEPQREYVKEFRDLQSAWKKAGPAPRDAEAALWRRFRGACDRFFAWLDEGRVENLRQKEALCEEVEALVANTADAADPREAAGKIAALQKRWQEIGPVPQEHADPIWERFRKPCDAFFAAREEQFAKLEAARRDNEEKKLELLYRAEELVDGGDTKDVADALKQLQQEWNGLGPATREREPELRGRFASLCDEFFAGRRQRFAELEGQRRENLKAKEALCIELERMVGSDAAGAGAGENSALSLAEQLQLAFTANFALAGDQDTPERRLEEVRRIQERWREIGPVPREQDRALWARYRSLLDAFYADRREVE